LSLLFLSGSNTSTRDYRRFGQVILQNGNRQGRQIVPANWIAASAATSAPTDPWEIGYGYQWWLSIGSGL
jgi:CubicO group peptidase (beta-lactamase class C family)